MRERVAQWLRLLAVLPEDTGSEAPSRQLTNISNCSPRGSNDLCCFLLALQMWFTDRQTDRENTHIHKRKSLKKRKKLEFCFGLDIK